MIVNSCCERELPCILCRRLSEQIANIIHCILRSTKPLMSDFQRCPLIIWNVTNTKLKIRFPCRSVNPMGTGRFFLEKTFHAIEKWKQTLSCILLFYSKKNDFNHSIASRLKNHIKQGVCFHSKRINSAGETFKMILF